MKRCKKLISLLLLLAMLLTMVACESEPSATETTTPETTAPTEPPVSARYTQARAALDQATDMTSAFTLTLETAVGDTLLTQASTGTITYRNIGKDTATVYSEETATFSTDPEEEPMTYTELWSQGQLYAVLDDTHRIVAPLAQEDLADKFIPIVLLDESLYGSITEQEAEGGTLLTFTEATTPELWITDAELDYSDITGTALISAEGSVTEMTYTITVSYGLSQVTYNVSSKPQTELKEFTVPASAEDYIAVEDPTVLSLYASTGKLVQQASQIQTTQNSTVISEAAAWVMYGTVNFTTYGEEKDALAKITEELQLYDYGNNEEYNETVELTFQNGKATKIANNGLPSTYSSTIEEVTEPMWTNISSLYDYLSPDYWENATSTFFGNLQLIEFTLTENFGNTMQNDICATLFNDPSALTSMATKYENQKLTGYLSVDLCTGMPVSIGYSYEGIHGIQGYDLVLSKEVTLSIQTPAVNAYKTITDKLPETQEPEEKAAPLFYKVTGAEGQQMWLFGTIHVGDARIAYLPQEIKDAFTASDALALEFDADAFEAKLMEDAALASQVSALYYNEGGKSLEEILSEEDYKLLVQMLKATGIYSESILYLKPSFVQQSLTNALLDLGYTLTTDYGVESQLQLWAQEQNKPIRDVESGLFQTQMCANWSQELQILLLQNTFEDSPIASWYSSMELLDLWCLGDEDAVSEYLNTEVDPSSLTEEEKAEYEAAKPLMEEYDKTIELDRNAGMLQVAIEYLESGDVVFYAVGLAHLLNETNGLVTALREAGYTVELVTYA